MPRTIRMPSAAPIQANTRGSRRLRRRTWAARPGTYLMSGRSAGGGAIELELDGGPTIGGGMGRAGAAGIGGGMTTVCEAAAAGVGRIGAVASAERSAVTISVHVAQRSFGSLARPFRR